MQEDPGIFLLNEGSNELSFSPFIMEPGERLFIYCNAINGADIAFDSPNGPSEKVFTAPFLTEIESGSGETASLVVMAKKARESGARVATVTIHPEASIGRLADRIICLPGATPKSGLEDTCSSVQVMASSFEQLGWIVGDVLIHYLMERTGITGDEMYKRHANLE